jgi:adenylyl- and sulfurtransferase ThiI
MDKNEIIDILRVLGVSEYAIKYHSDCLIEKIEKEIEEQRSYWYDDGYSDGFRDGRDDPTN